MTIPNFITIARIFAVPVLVWLILDGLMAAAFWVFVAAGVSDALDGFIAKRYDLTTKLGSYLDPVADKALLVSAFVTLGQAENELGKSLLYSALQLILFVWGAEQCECHGVG